MSESKTVRLGELDHDPIAIAGKDARYLQLDDLKASIPAMGQLQSLNVRPAGDGAAPGVIYWVKAGNRRLATLRALRDAKAEILGTVVTDDFPVHVIFGDADDEQTFRAMVAENVQRLAPTPMEEARDFAAMVKTASVKQIALQFAVKPRYVEQRLKLAGLHPDVQGALESGKIGLEAAEAFTLEADPERQAKYLKDAKQDWHLRADQVRKAFTDELVPSDGPTAKLIGKKAYTDAGGVVMADSFGDKGYWISRDVIDQLLDSHWVDQVAAWKAEGWAWVADAAEYPGSEYGYISGVSHEYPRAGKFTADQREFCGVIYWRNGRRDPELGVVDARRKARPQTGNELVQSKPKPTLADPGATVLQDLHARLTKAVQVSVVGQYGVVLQLLYATLASQKYGTASAAVGITGIAPRGNDAPSFVEALETAKTMPHIGLVDAIAQFVAPSVRLYSMGNLIANDAIVALLDPVTADHFDPADYFASVRKDIVALAWEDMTGEKMKDGKKGDMGALAVAKATETGWLPPQLRGPRYPGPGLSFAQMQEDRAAAAAERERQRTADDGDDDGEDLDDEEFVEDELAEAAE